MVYLILYLVIVFIYFYLTGKKQNRLQKIILSICLPVFGLISVIISDFNIKKTILIYNKTGKTIDEIKDSKFLLTKQSTLWDNLENNEFEKVRETILSIGSLTLPEQAKIYNTAMKSENMEIAHIAAVSRMRIQTHFENYIAHIERNSDKNKIENLKKEIREIDRYIQCNFTYGTLRLSLINKEVLLIKKLAKEEKNIEEKYYILLLKYIILLDKNTIMNENVEEIVEKVLEKDPNNTTVYLYYLNICYKTGNVERFNECLQYVKKKFFDDEKLKRILEFWEE